MPKLVDPTIQKLLGDEEWLYIKHVTELYSITELANQLQVTPGTVRKALRKHNIKSPSQQKLREASLSRKHGVTNSGQIPGSRKKALDTMIERYGGHVWSYVSTKRIERDKTCIDKYGNKNVSLTDYAKQKTTQTNNDRYGRDHVNQKHISDDGMIKLSSIEWIWEQHKEYKRPLVDIATELGVDASILANRLHKHGLQTQHFFRSVGEEQLSTFIASLIPKTLVLNNDRDVIAPNELDVYIPSLNLAVEYCGLYWHSDRFKNRTYHADKLDACNAKGVRLLTIFEDEWIGKTDIVKKKLKSILRTDDCSVVYARNTTVVAVTNATKKSFFDRNHIQGNGPGSITYGLRYDNEVVAVMTFVNKGCGEYVLNRYATSCRVPGGFSKLLKHFQRHHEWKKLVSFADRRWSEGQLYEKTGWIQDKVLSVDYYWTKNNQRFHKFGFRHKQLASKLVNYDPSLSEHWNCKNHGYDKIYNCGLKRYVLKNDVDY